MNFFPNTKSEFMARKQITSQIISVKWFPVGKCLHFHFRFSYASSLLPMPYQKATVLFRRKCQDCRTMSWSYNSFTKMKDLEGKQNCIINVVWTTAMNNQSDRTPYYLKQQYILLVHFTIALKSINSERCFILCETHK